MSGLATQATQDYLKVIYQVCEDHSRASTGQIADELGVTPASVTGMLKKLAASEPALLSYRKHQGAVLTPEGERLALQIIRSHRLLECFLHDTLGYAWDEVPEEAERLEHAISGPLGRRIADLLQEPEHDPHGAPIPTRDLQMPADCSVPLDELTPGQDACVKRVSDRDPQLLRYLAEISLIPGTELTLLQPLPFSDHVRLRYGGGNEAIIISARVACQVFVIPHQRAGEAGKHDCLIAGEQLT